jgi:hypothetical protein
MLTNKEMDEMLKKLTITSEIKRVRRLMIKTILFMPFLICFMIPIFGVIPYALSESMWFFAIGCWLVGGLLLVFFVLSVIMVIIMSKYLREMTDD